MSAVQTLYSRLEILSAIHRERIESIAAAVADEDPLFAGDIHTIIATDDAVQHLLLHRPTGNDQPHHAAIRVAIGKLERTLIHGPASAIYERVRAIEHMRGGLDHLLQFDRVRRLVTTAPFGVLAELFHVHTHVMLWASTNNVVALLDAATVGRRATDTRDDRVVCIVVDAIMEWRSHGLPIGDLNDVFDAAVRQGHPDVAHALVGIPTRPTGAPFRPLFKNTVGLFRPWYEHTEHNALTNIIQNYSSEMALDVPFLEKPETVACLTGDVTGASVFGDAINGPIDPLNGRNIIIHAALSIPDALLVPLFILSALDVNNCDTEGYTLLSTILYRRLDRVPTSHILHVVQALLFCKGRALTLDKSEWQFVCPGNPFFQACVAELNAEASKRPAKQETFVYTSVVNEDEDEDEDNEGYEINSDGEYCYTESVATKRYRVCVE